MLLEPATKPYQISRKKPNVLLFVGLQGAGKTPTIAKFAGYYARKGWKVSMVCCDSFRAGAFDQLKQVRMGENRSSVTIVTINPTLFCRTLPS